MKKTVKDPEIAKENYLKIKKAALKKIAVAKKAWSDSCIANLANIKDPEDAIVTFKKAPWGTPAKLKALEKVAELCTTIKQLAEMYHEHTRKRLADFEDNPVLQKWEYLSRIDVHLATTLEEIQLVYWSCPYFGYYDLASDDSAISRAFKKWVQLCTSAEDLNTLNHSTVKSHYHKSEIVSKRMKELELYYKVYFM